MQIPEHEHLPKGKGIYDNVKRFHTEYAHVEPVNRPSPQYREFDHTRPSQQDHDRFPVELGRSGKPRNARDREKRYGISDPVVWDAICRSLAQQKRLSSLVSPVRVKEPSRKLKPPRIPSRTSSRRRTLNRFAHELDKYAKAADAKGRLPVITPVESNEQASLRTVKPLLPYIDEFGAAGLAVTSEQQRHQSPESLGRKTPACKYAMPVRQSNDIHHVLSYDGPYETLSDTERSSTDSLIDFAQPQKSTATRADPLPVPKQPSNTGKDRLPWLKKASIDTVRPRQRIGTMVEVAKGDWRVANEAGEVSSKSRTTLPTNQAKTLSTQRKHSRPLPCLAQTRPSVVRPHITEYVKPPSNRPKEAATPQRADSPKFRTSRDLAQGSLPPSSQAEGIKPLSKTHHHFHHHHEPPNHPEADFPKWLDRQHHAVLDQPTHPDSPPLVPQLPNTWKYAVGDTSSLEQALNEAAQHVRTVQVEKAEHYRTISTSNKPISTRIRAQRPPFDHKHHPLLTKDSCLDEHKPKRHLTPATPWLTKENISTTTRANEPDATAKQIEVPESSARTALPVSDLIEINDKPQSMPAPTAAEPSSSSKRRPSPRSPSKLQAVLGDLDVFFDSDDATIDDRDVIKGLQVAVRAAADDLYDALIRNKTGLRIRRFLADLRSVEAFDKDLAVNGPRSLPRDGHVQMGRSRGKKTRVS